MILISKSLRGVLLQELARRIEDYDDYLHNPERGLNAHEMNRQYVNGQLNEVKSLRKFVEELNPYRFEE